MSDKQIPDEAPTILLAVADAAMVWWTMQRPVTWSRERHLAHPRINCHSGVERELADAVAAWARVQDGRCESEAQR